jgi:hypothetical protein
MSGEPCAAVQIRIRTRPGGCHRRRVGIGPVTIAIELIDSLGLTSYG